MDINSFPPPHEYFDNPPPPQESKSLQEPVEPKKTHISSNNFRGQKKIIATIFAFLLLTTSVGVGVYLTQKKQQTQVGAANVDLSLSTTRATPQVGETFVVAVRMNPNGMAVNGADVRINFDPGILTAASITPGTLLPNVLIGGSISGGTGMIVVGCPIDATGPHPVSASGLIAQITFTARARGTANITFGNATTISVSGQTQNFVGTMSPVSITVGSTGSPTPTPTRTPTPRPTSTPTRTPTIHPTPTVSPTVRPTPTPTPTIRPTPTRTPTPTPTRSPSSTPTRTPTPSAYIIPGDINRDGHVTIVDVGILVDNYDLVPPGDPRADIDGDGDVDIVDVGILIDNYEL